MVVGAEGENLGAMPTDIAMKRAEEAGLDLVEVAPEARPPVCKILDYGKYKYLQKKKQAEAKRHQTHQDLKEVKLRPKTDDHDYDFKVKHCRRFLESGDKVKVTIMFRGREVIHKDIAVKRLKGIAKDVEDLAKVEASPKMEGRTMHMILAPKVGAGRKAPKASTLGKKSGLPPDPKRIAAQQAKSAALEAQNRAALAAKQGEDAAAEEKSEDPEATEATKSEATEATKSEATEATNNETSADGAETKSAPPSAETN